MINDKFVCCIKAGKSVLENDFWTPPPPAIKFVHDNYFSTKLLLFIFYYFRVRLGLLAFLAENTIGFSSIMCVFLSLKRRDNPI